MQRLYARIWGLTRPRIGLYHVRLIDINNALPRL
jgi:hypothetical protein